MLLLFLLNITWENNANQILFFISMNCMKLIHKLSFGWTFDKFTSTTKKLFHTMLVTEILLPKVSCIFI